MVRCSGGSASCIIQASLQWSHVFSDMVRLNEEGIKVSVIPASMEPCLFRHGKGPGRGYFRALSLTASMEPCLFRHGKGLNTGSKSGRFAWSFNGAMSFQTW